MSLLALLTLAIVNVGAQADLNCDDFANQHDAQMSLNTSYPEDPNRLDADGDWIACEDFFGLSDEDEARVVPANLVNDGAQSTQTPEPAPTAAGPVAAPVSTSTATSSRIDPPADLMARVASCEVVAVSSRSIAAAGCPGVGSIVLRPPAGTPRMRSQVIIRPGAAFGTASDRVATAAQTASPANAPEKRERGQRERPRRKHQRTVTAAERKN